MFSISVDDKTHKVALKLADKNSMTIEQVFAQAIQDMEKKSQADASQKEFSMSKQIDEWMKIADAKLPDTLQAMLDAGVSLVYTNKDGQMVEEMPDGTIKVIEEKDNDG